MPQSLAPCTPRLAGLWFFGRLRRFRVQGASMEPTLRAGQSVLVNPRAFRGLRPQPGQIVLLRHPADPNRVLVKRVRSLEGERLFVVGDNRASSTDSRDFGAVALESVLGLVVCTFGLSN